MDEFQLGVLSRAESIDLLHKHRSDAAASDLDAIAAEVGDLPLALHLAGSFLETYRTVVSPAAYLSQLCDQSLLEHPSMQGRGAAHSPTGHDLHVGRTFALSYDCLQPEDETDAQAIAVLARAACFAPNEPIPRDLLLATLETGQPSSDRGCLSSFTQFGQRSQKPMESLLEDNTLLVEDALVRLANLGLLEQSPDGTPKLHPLVTAYVQHLASTSIAQDVVEWVVIDRAYDDKAKPISRELTFIGLTLVTQILYPLNKSGESNKPGDRAKKGARLAKSGK